MTGFLFVKFLGLRLVNIFPETVNLPYLFVYCTFPYTINLKSATLYQSNIIFMNLKTRTSPAIFISHLMKLFVLKLTQNPDYYPTKHLTKTKRKYRHNESLL